MTTGSHLGYRLQGQGLLANVQAGQEMVHHGQPLHIQDELLQRANQPGLQPAGAVENDVGVSQHGRPERHLGLVGGLGVGRLGVVQAAATPVPGYQRPGCRSACPQWS